MPASGMVHQPQTAGQAVARVDGKSPDVSGPAGRKGFKAELDGLRERMRGLGFPYDEIAAEIGRRYLVRPREAYRLAWGWPLEQAAARFNDRAARHGTDPEARASEFEHWPRSTRKPSVYVLVMLAEIYETDVLCLLDLADHESLPQQDRLVLLRRPRAETPFGERTVALMEARSLSMRETAPGPPAPWPRAARPARKGAGNRCCQVSADGSLALQTSRNVSLSSRASGTPRSATASITSRARQ